MNCSAGHRHWTYAFFLGSSPVQSFHHKIILPALYIHNMGVLAQFMSDLENLVLSMYFCVNTILLCDHQSTEFFQEILISYNVLCCSKEFSGDSSGVIIRSVVLWEIISMKTKPPLSSLLYCFSSSTFFNFEEKMLWHLLITESIKEFNIGNQNPCNKRIFYGWVLFKESLIHSNLLPVILCGLCQLQKSESGPIIKSQN